MQSEKEITARLNELLADERLYYPAATVKVNAPLALIQLSMEVEIHTLQRVLQQPLTSFNKLRKTVTANGKN